MVKKKNVYEMFGGVKYKRAHVCRILRSAREWQKEFKKEGYLSIVEKEKPGRYHVYVSKGGF